MIRLSVPGTLLYRDVVLRVVASGCRLLRTALSGEQEASQAPHAPEFDERVVSAVGEAFNNVALHAYGERRSGTVELEIELDGDRITIRVSDTGAGFDPAAQLSPDLPSLPESHMGLWIMQSCMDEVRYARGTRPSVPNVLTLIKHYLTPTGTQRSS